MGIVTFPKYLSAVNMTDSDRPNRETNRWADDVLGRKRLADFLTRSISESARLRMESRGEGLTLALDSDWGTGKTFFIRHWADDLRGTGHPVIVFDAWENDIGDEAAVALMSSIKIELERWTSQLPSGKKFKQKAKAATSSAIRELRKAIIPTSKVIAAGVLKKATGIAVEEIFEAYTNAPTNPPKTLSDAASDTLECGLDELFKSSLEEHQKRGAAIRAFKTSISDLIQLLETEANANVPVFVFVDEVDRCRPTYAIKLLEEIKHIFGVPKICFVVSTNLDQLRESVRAIYGAGFDGHRYLKRFFDHQYTLPEPDNESFSAQLLSQESAIRADRTVNGLPVRPEPAGLKKSIAVIATAFELDLRSQKQIFDIANSVAAVIPKEKKIFILWLFFLCALQHKNPNLLKRLNDKHLDAKEFDSVCREALKKDVEIEYLESRDSYGHKGSTRKASLSNVLRHYYEWSFEDLLKLRDRNSETNIYNYPNSNINALAEEAPNPYNSSSKYPPSIASYAEWVRYAGLAYDD